MPDDPYEVKLQREDEARWRRTHEFLKMTCEAVVRESIEPINFLGVVDQYLTGNEHLVYFWDYNEDVSKLVSKIENYRDQCAYFNVFINMEKYVEGPGPGSFIEIDENETRNHIVGR